FAGDAEERQEEAEQHERQRPGGGEAARWGVLVTKVHRGCPLSMAVAERRENITEGSGASAGRPAGRGGVPAPGRTGGLPRRSAKSEAGPPRVWGRPRDRFRTPLSGRRPPAPLAPSALVAGPGPRGGGAAAAAPPLGLLPGSAPAVERSAGADGSGLAVGGLRGRLLPAGEVHRGTAAADRRDRGGDQAAEGGTGHRQRAAATGAAALVRRGLVVALVAVLAVLAAVTGRGGRRGRRGGRRGRLPVIVVLAGDGDLRQLGRSTGLAGGDGGVAALLGGLEGDRAGAEHDLGAVAGGELAVQVVAPALLLGEGVLGVPGPAGAHRDR